MRQLSCVVLLSYRRTDVQMPLHAGGRDRQPQHQRDAPTRLRAWMVLRLTTWLEESHARLEHPSPKMALQCSTHPKAARTLEADHAWIRDVLPSLRDAAGRGEKWRTADSWPEMPYCSHGGVF